MHIRYNNQRHLHSCISQSENERHLIQVHVGAISQRSLSVFAFIFSFILLSYKRNKLCCTTLLYDFGQLLNLAIFFILTEICISFQRYLMLRNKKLMKNVSYKRIIVLIAFVSIVYYFPNFFLNKLVSAEVFNNSSQTN